MNWSVVHYTFFSEKVLQKGLTFEEAKNLCMELADSEPSDGLGQTKRPIEALMEKKVPFQIEIKTMTAEAGEVLDVYAVVLSSEADKTLCRNAVDKNQP